MGSTEIDDAIDDNRNQTNDHMARLQPSRLRMDIIAENRKPMLVLIPCVRLLVFSLSFLLFLLRYSGPHFSIGAASFVQHYIFIAFVTIYSVYFLEYLLSCELYYFMCSSCVHLIFFLRHFIMPSLVIMPIRHISASRLGLM